MAELARAAEARQGPSGELSAAYATLKAYVELLLTLHRETLQDVGFWEGVMAAARVGALYEHTLAPGFDLLADGKSPTGMHYPAGRAIVVGLPLGIR